MRVASSVSKEMVSAVLIALVSQAVFFSSFTDFFYRPMEMQVFFGNIAITTGCSRFIWLSLKDGNRNTSARLLSSVVLGGVIAGVSPFVGEFVFPILYAVEIYFAITLIKFFKALFSKVSPS